MFGWKKKVEAKVDDLIRELEEAYKVIDELKGYNELKPAYGYKFKDYGRDYG